MPQVTTFHDDRALARTLAAKIVEMIAAKPDLVLGLPTGRTPVRLYHELGAMHAKGQADFSRVTTFNLDEFLGVPPEHPGSYRSFMQEHLFSRVNIPGTQINLLNGVADDPLAECIRYERAIVAAGGLDLQLLGIGTNGHIGFNEPARELTGATHRVVLKPSTRHSNAGLFGGDEASVPREALSMGMATILRARRIILIATGKSKAACVERAVHGPITTRMPASFLQLPRDVELVLDEAAAAKLSRSGPQ